MPRQKMMIGHEVNIGIRVLPFAERLGVAAELMGSLELTTRSGQGHVMNRVLAILRQEVLGAEGPLAASDVAGLMDAMSELEHEAGRIAPLPTTFNRHAHLVIDALLRVTPPAPTG
jgi:hypothetical protein